MKIRVAVCDSSRMRYFAVDPDNGALHEIDDRVHEASRQRVQDLASDRPGLGDERDIHKHEVALFAKEVEEILNRDTLEGNIIRLYILAPPEFLGLLRKELRPATAALVEADKAANVVAESVDRIRRQLPDRL